MVTFCLLADEWVQLLGEGEELLAGSFASGTLRNLRCQWARFRTFCEYYGVRNRFPASIQLLVAYMAWLCRTVKSQDTVRNYVHGLKVLHSLQGMDVSNFSDITVTLALRGVDRRLRYTPRRAQPITPGMLTRMVANLDKFSPTDATTRALFLMSFFLFLRKSSTVSNSVRGFDGAKQLVRGDCKRKGGILFVYSKWSKTNQFGKRSHGVPLLPLKDSPLCPVAAYDNMCRLVPGVDTDPAFCSVVDGVRKPLTYAVFQRRLKASVTAIGLDPDRFSTHSFRRGGATLAFRAGIAGDTIKILGEWRSEAYQVYLECPIEVKAAASNLFREAVLARANNF